jgi:hypothetical protein
VPGCGRIVGCSADVPIVIEFERLPDGRYLAWATVPPGEPVTDITVVIEGGDALAYSVSNLPAQISSSDRTLVSVHECS